MVSARKTDYILYPERKVHWLLLIMSLMQPQAQKVFKLLPGAAKGEFLYLPFFLTLLLQASVIEDPHKKIPKPYTLKAVPNYVKKTEEY